MSAYREAKQHGTHAFPYIVYLGILPERISGFPLHWHEEMEIIYVTEGKMLVSVRNSEYTVQSGDIVIVHPQAIHAIKQFEEHSAKYYNILFRFSMLESGTDDVCREKYLNPIHERRLLMPELLKKGHPLHGEIEPIIRKLTENPHHQRFNEELMIKSRVFEMMFMILPYCEKADKGTVFEDIVYEKLKRSLRFLEENYAENLTIEKMAAVSNYSESHFSKLFRELTGESFTQYLKNYRLEIAAERIGKESAGISEIAVSCGFSNLSYFSRSFFDKYGLSPSQFRKTRSTD